MIRSRSKAGRGGLVAVARNKISPLIILLLNDIITAFIGFVGLSRFFGVLFFTLFGYLLLAPYDSLLSWGIVQW